MMRATKTRINGTIRLGTSKRKFSANAAPGKGHKAHTADHRSHDAERDRPARQTAIGDEVFGRSLLPASNPKTDEADHREIQQDGQVVQKVKCIH